VRELDELPERAEPRVHAVVIGHVVAVVAVRRGKNGSQTQVTPRLVR
jgi:hypothetical protein